jgi:hypothetical protein
MMMNPLATTLNLRVRSSQIKIQAARANPINLTEALDPRHMNPNQNMKISLNDGTSKRGRIRTNETAKYVSAVPSSSQLLATRNPQTSR